MTVCSYFVQCHDQASFRLRLYPLKRLLSSKFCRPQPFQPNFSATCGACEGLLSEHDIDRNLNISSCVTCGVGICYSKTVLATRPTLNLLLQRNFLRFADGVRVRFDDASSLLRNSSDTYVAKRFMTWGPEPAMLSAYSPSWISIPTLRSPQTLIRYLVTLSINIEEGTESHFRSRFLPTSTFGDSSLHQEQ